MQPKNQVIVFGKVIFEKPELSLNVRPTELKKETAILLAVAAWTSNLIVYFYNALDVLSPKMEFIW